ncbi:ribosomal-protein-alanine N-acetyltransferase [Pullulanibacillus pueri]|uniref:[Ribosomal protein bS18]-alanine N-acetyltransferase n=1 Tax=Pullulanibacillus pueri TaxID=1437324 RepID=A0A8J3EM21_9BACL|nr:ribosomal protein S18-alanine N-acetyltransferase [Pullulanibacillus pueri]MBM7682837.1 ribosomal-protein-alanine N-acetyltransferase [Pullulanibacillus pueri]GGH83389.1 ribosomal-protein-alanine acetyltransferase [Pullulanibacillus pueri]
MGEGIQIREMTLEDVDGVYNVETKAFNNPWKREAFVNEIKNNQFATYFVAVDDDYIVGYCGVWLILDESHITNIAVLPNYRGYKIGETLLKKAMLFAKIGRAIRMSLEVRVSNEIAQNLYRKLGFQEGGIRRNYYSDNLEDAIVMWVNL